MSESTTPVVPANESALQKLARLQREYDAKSEKVTDTTKVLDQLRKRVAKEQEAADAAQKAFDDYSREIEAALAPAAKKK